ncbi:MAG TPA: hypothetical protein ENH94_01150 [Phycisphaerales bacterium]|nr:hypothetical protein [Phycisphaerales bacterium]
MAIYRKKNLDHLRIKSLALIIAMGLLAATASAANAATDPAAAQTFYTQFVNAGGPIVWFLLLPMSVITGYLVINLAVTIRRKKLVPRGIVSEIADIHKRLGIERLVITIADRTDLVSKAVLTAITKSKNLQADPKYINSLAAESLQESTMGLFRRVEWCAIIGNVAPMIGLFGTVFGMIRAFNILGIAGSQPPADQLAAAISIALVTTFWGLLVAIPALAMHGIFRSRIETIVSEAALEIEILLQRITTQPITKVPAPQITTPQATLPHTPTVTTAPLPSKQPLTNKPIMEKPAPQEITQRAPAPARPTVTTTTKQALPNKPVTKKPLQTQAAKK